jgi:putative hydrolase of the HAD superfamily
VLCCYILRSSSSGSAVAVVFVGDDTLWSTEPLYDLARQLARAEVARSGIDDIEWERLERQLDVENVSQFGFNTDRFPTSCVQAYEALCRTGNRRPDAEVAERVRSAARRVFTEDPPLVPGARDTLEALRARGARLALLTKGDRELQASRVERSGIANFFDVIRIVPEKVSDTFREIVAALGAVPEHSWSVGNSIRSDILPAVESGLRAVWIDAHVWEHERFHGNFVHDRVFTVSSISDVADVIEA